ncbi:exodeoxyribonuclease I [Litorivicinus sp.]|nr:exodeoxyribonuclease I [Litorivicinus sp.]
MQILWYDYETSGRDPVCDRPVQMGWQITDAGMEPLGDADSVLVRLPDDVLPSPAAMLIHQIVPEIHQRDGLTEAELAQRLEDLITPNTVVAGYNSRQFDDKFTQHVFYRSLRDPYRWQYEGGRARFDLYPVVLSYFVFAPDALRWPEDGDGRPRFKLDRIGPLNQLDLGLKRAHDASADVTVTARLARLLAHYDADFFANCLKLIDKHYVIDVIRADGRSSGLLEVTTFAGWDSGYVRDLWVPFRTSEKSKDFVGFDLNQNPEDVLAGLASLSKIELLDLDRLKQLRLLGVHVIRTNAQPMIFSRQNLDSETEKRLANFGRDIELQNQHLDLWQHIQESPVFKQLYQLTIEAMAESESRTDPDVDYGLYSGGFLSPADRKLLAQCPLMDSDALKNFAPPFEDPRYPELVFRYRARNFPSSLSPAEWRRWTGIRRSKLTRKDGKGMTVLRLNDELLSLTEESLEAHQSDQLERFILWLDNQPPI